MIRVGVPYNTSSVICYNILSKRMVRKLSVSGAKHTTVVTNKWHQDPFNKMGDKGVDFVTPFIVV